MTVAVFGVKVGAENIKRLAGRHQDPTPGGLRCDRDSIGVWLRARPTVASCATTMAAGEYG